MTAGNLLYFDHAATSALLPEARAAMESVWAMGPGNPHALDHPFGWQAQKIVEDCQQQLLTAFNASLIDSRIIWTSGATEANNLALQGWMQKPDTPKRLIIGATEHASIHAVAHHLAGQGIDLVVLDVDSNGQIDLASLEAALQTTTGLVSLMAANNETGILHPVSEIAALCRRYQTPFHCDASQVSRFGRDYLPDLGSDNAGPDLVTLSGHKCGGPVGIGALLCRQKHPVPIVFGGDQQQTLRPGTLPVALIAGFAAAFLHYQTIDNWSLQRHCREFETALQQRFSELVILGQDQERLPGFSAFALYGQQAETIFQHCPDLALASGAACSSATGHMSTVLEAMGVDQSLAASSIRLSAAHDTPALSWKIALEQLSSAL